MNAFTKFLEECLDCNKFLSYATVILRLFWTYVSLGVRGGSSSTKDESRVLGSGGAHL